MAMRLDRWTIQKNLWSETESLRPTLKLNIRKGNQDSRHVYLNMWNI